MAAIMLPTRRDEAWKYSDLRAALGEDRPPLAGEGEVIERLATAAGEARVQVLAPGSDEVERIDLDGAGFFAGSSAVRLEAGAKLTRIIVQTNPDVPLFFTRVSLAQGAQFRQFVLAEGAKLARVETHVEVDGEDAQVALNGVYLCSAGRHADLTSLITHAAPHGTTRQLVRGVARKGGRGVFQGKILVAQGAQKTDAEQHHDALLLEEGAEVNAKPELEIYADDVACAHGNTAGSLDERALFYMRARGVPLEQARALLIEAFLRQAIPEWLPAEVADEVDARIADWLEGGP